MIPTFLGISFIFFLILQLAPGGPLEQEIMKLKAGASTEAGASTSTVSGDISPKAMAQLKKFYGFDKPLLQRYLIWLGLYPREINDKKIDFDEPFRVHVEFINYEGRIYELQKWAVVRQVGDEIQFFESATGADFAFDGYPELPNHSKIKNWYPETGWKYEKNEFGEHRVYQTKFSGVIQGNLGTSYVYRRPVAEIIGERLHISAYFGLVGFLLAYMVSIPLGIKKAIHHKSLFDTLSSVWVFIGYSIPGFAAGLLLLMFFASSSFLDIFPLGSFRSLNFEDLSFFGKIWDQIYHTILPVIAWTLGSFATLTMLMKNSLLENLSQDYVRTAFAKGLSEKRVIIGHALRNSLIPLATNIGTVIGVVFAGSYLIEKTFNINGIGLLSLDALITRDYPISLGFMVISTVVGVVGNLISDITYALLDPRIRFK